MITLIVALALAAPNPGAIAAPRHAFAACLRSFETNQLAAKVDPAAALRVQRNGETGALTPAQRSLIEQRRGETGAAAAAAVDALTADDFLASVGFRREHSGLGPNKVIAGPAIGNGAMVWLGTNPGPAGKLSTDPVQARQADQGVGHDDQPGGDQLARQQCAEERVQRVVSVQQQRALGGEDVTKRAIAVRHQE